MFTANTTQQLFKLLYDSELWGDILYADETGKQSFVEK